MSDDMLAFDLECCGDVHKRLCFCEIPPWKLSNVRPCVFLKTTYVFHKRISIHASCLRIQIQAWLKVGQNKIVHFNYHFKSKGLTNQWHKSRFQNIWKENCNISPRIAVNFTCCTSPNFAPSLINSSRVEQKDPKICS